MGKAKNSGTYYENDVGKFLQKYDGVDEQHEEMLTEHGRIGWNKTIMGFDVLSKTYGVECKIRESLPNWLVDTFTQIIEKAQDMGKKPLLTIKEKYGPELHIITRERHRELLEKENKLEGVKDGN